MRRRSGDRLWTEADHDRYERTVAQELHKLRQDVERIEEAVHALDKSLARVYAGVAVAVAGANIATIVVLRFFLPP